MMKGVRLILECTPAMEKAIFDAFILQEFSITQNKLW